MTALNEMIHNVITEVVRHNLCIGCGLCAGICPHEALQMQFNSFGEYTPEPTANSCSSTCSICLKTCPFYAENPYEDQLGQELFGKIAGVQYRPETGYHLQSWLGFCADEKQRLRSASGGLATWVQQQLLRQNIVDAVISVTPCNGPEKLFEYTIKTREEELGLCARSAYYPVHLAEIVRHILKTQEKYAVIGLPCAVKGLRLAARQSPRLRDRIRFHLGLVCEMSRSRGYTEYLCALAGGKPDKVKQIQFRLKSSDHSVTDYGISLKWKSEGGESVCKTIYRSQYYDRLSGRYFVPHACSFCDDTFCETADAVFMDAWLPQCNDYRGASIVLVREPLIAEIIEKGIADSHLQAHRLSIEKALQSQFSVVRKKRGVIHFVSKHAKKKGQHILPKRKPLSGLKLSFWDRWLAIRNYELAKASRDIWVKSNKDVHVFCRQILPWANRVRAISRWQFFIRNPHRAVNRLLKILKAKKVL